MKINTNKLNEQCIKALIYFKRLLGLGHWDIQLSTAEIEDINEREIKAKVNDVQHDYFTATILINSKYEFRDIKELRQTILHELMHVFISHQIIDSQEMSLNLVILLREIVKDVLDRSEESAVNRLEYYFNRIPEFQKFIEK